MRRQAKRTLVVLIAIIVLIASQLLGAVYACANTSAAGTNGISSTRVVFTSTVSMTSMTLLNVHGDLHDQHAANLCQAHCDISGQPDHSPQPTPSPVVWLPMVWGFLDFQRYAAQTYVPAHTESPLTAAFPPPRILFQVFRT